MSLITATGLCKSWSDKDVLKNVCVTLAPRQRVGVVGPNGGGKTTLIRILAGLEKPTDGTVDRKRDLRMGYLPQDPPDMQGDSLRQAMQEVFADLHRMENELHDLAHQMADDGDGEREEHEKHEKHLKRYGELQHEFETRGGYTYSHKIEQVLTGLNFPKEIWDRPLAELSGGQRTRAYLGRLLLQSPDVLLLDEPTNHLDYTTVEWLEGWLQSFPGAVVVVSHDRYFLDRVTTSTWEITSATLESYKGNYSHYLTQREERVKERMHRWEAQQVYIRETQDFIARFLAGQRSSEAKGRRTRLARFLKTEAIDKPREYAHISVCFKVTERTGDMVLRAEDIQAGYDAAAPLVKVEQLEIQRGRRVAIVGPNGCGKTTLVRTLLGELPALAGKVRFGANVRVGYLSQTHAELDPQASAVDVVRHVDPTITEQRARNLLGSLLLSNDDAFKLICELSGGQRSRIVLARLMLQRANVLIMDEPTNHLDVHSQEVLQEVLSDFDGTLIFVSHDRYLIHALATDMWAMHDGTITTLKGDWDHYLSWRDRQDGTNAKKTARKNAKTAAKNTAGSADDKRQQHQDRREEKKLQRRKANDRKKLQRQFEQVEKQIHSLEDRLQAISEEISDASAGGDMALIEKLGADYAAEDSKLRELYQRWEQLAADVEEG